MHPVHIPVIGFWYRKSSSGMQQTVRKNEALRAESDKYIKELAKDVNIHIQEEMYQGQLPDTAVRSEYSSSDNLLAKIMFCRLGVWLVERIYRAKG